MHALIPTTVSAISIMFYFSILYVFKADVALITPINIISNVIISIIFLVVNAFVIISKGIDEKKDNEVTIGLFFIFLLPLIFFASIPMTITFYILLKIRRTKEKTIRVTEEELFEDVLSVNDYSNNEISVDEYISQLKYNSNL
ncbi:MAG: hypothetical protein MJ232_01635 [archaeon]|nr:hypothetical protein [archaeon]